MNRPCSVFHSAWLKIARSESTFENARYRLRHNAVMPAMYSAVIASTRRVDLFIGCRSAAGVERRAGGAPRVARAVGQHPEVVVLRELPRRDAAEPTRRRRGV